MYSQNQGKLHSPASWPEFPDDPSMIFLDSCPPDTPLGGLRDISHSTSSRLYARAFLRDWFCPRCLPGSSNDFTSTLYSHKTCWFSFCLPRLPTPSAFPLRQPLPWSMSPWCLVPNIHKSHRALVWKLSSDHASSQLESFQWLMIKTTLLSPPHNPTLPTTWGCGGLTLWIHRPRLKTHAPLLSTLAMETAFHFLKYTCSFRLRDFALAVSSSVSVYPLSGQLITIYLPGLSTSVWLPSLTTHFSWSLSISSITFLKSWCTPSWNGHKHVITHSSVHWLI